MIPIDENADTFPAGLQGTPFEEVYKALRTVAASVWAVDPTAYRAGMAWGWYALNAPDKLTGFRAVVVAALISAFAPMLKDNQTDAELAEYLRLWRAYKPTFGALGELFSVFGASVEVRAISDAESQSVVPVSDTRLAFYLRITGIDFSRPLSLSEAVEIARRATPLGSRPFAYYAIPSRISVPCGPAPEPAFVFVENNVVAELSPMDFVLLDENGSIRGGIPYTSNSFTGTGHLALQDASEVVETGTGHVALQDANEVVFVENEPEPQPDYLDVFFYYNADGNSVTFAANDYWSTRIRNDSDKAALENFGVPIGTSGTGWQYVARTAVESFTFTPVALYAGDGAGDLQADMSNFYCALRSGNPDPASLYYGVCIWSISPYGTNTQTWKCRITRNS